MRDAKGSSKEFSFRLLSKIKNNTLHIFESSIDLLSYATLLKQKGYDYQNQNLLALAGVYQPGGNIEQSKVPIAVKNFLERNTYIENIVLHFDNDRAGRNPEKIASPRRLLLHNCNTARPSSPREGAHRAVRAVKRPFMQGRLAAQG